MLSPERNSRRDTVTSTNTDACTSSTAVTLSFVEVRREGGGARIDWSTTSEVANAGFNLYVVGPAGTSKLNDALEGHSALQGMSVEEMLHKIESVPGDIRTAVRNNGGGHANHSLFWTIMKPEGGGEPDGDGASQSAGMFFVLGRRCA